VYVSECLKKCLKRLETPQTTSRIQVQISEISIALEKFQEKLNTDINLLPIGLYYAVRFLSSENSDNWVVFRFDETSFQNGFRSSKKPFGCFESFVALIQSVHTLQTIFLYYLLSLVLKCFMNRNIQTTLLYMKILPNRHQLLG
jgi:hypothetical protein